MEFDGMPNRPLTHAELREKFMMFVRMSGPAQAAATFDRLQNIEREAELQWVGAF